jgi:hypothetical protein
MWNKARTGILVDKGNGLLAFLENGSEFESLKNTALDWHEAKASIPPPLPIEQQRARMVCSRFQARAALHMAGLLPAVEEFIADADPLVKIAWADAVEFRRTSPTINAMAAGLGMTDEQVDDLFRTAMQIEA